MSEVQHRPDINTIAEARAEHERTGKPISFGRVRIIQSETYKHENHSTKMIAYMHQDQPERNHIALRITAHDTANMAETAELGGKALEWQGRRGRNELLDTGEQFFLFPPTPPKDVTVKLTTKTGEVFTFSLG